MSESDPGRLDLAALRSLVESGEIDTVELALVDIQGRLQGKRLDATHFLEDVAGHGAEACSYLLASDVEMGTVEGYELTSWERGYGDFVLRPDLRTLRRIPWHERTVFLLADVEDASGAPVAASPRQLLQSQVDLLEARSWHGLAGTELEFMVFNDTYEAAWNAGYRGLVPANLYNVDYSLQGTSRIEPLLGRIRRSMRGASMAVESVKGECNFGQHEIAFRYAPLVEKADEHSLFKLGAKEIAAQEGCSLTFMAKYDEREGNSCHVHFSLRDEADNPVFAGGGPHGFSPTFEHFLAGLLASSRELSLLFAPNINSYKRFVEGSFAPTALVWGLDNRTCAFRVVGHGTSLRVETRIPGGDVNPYLALSAIVAAGIDGVERELELEEPYSGNAYLAEASRVPTSLREAAALFADSELARSAFGDEVVAHYVNAAEVELRAYGAAVTDWERYRGFERL